MTRIENIAAGECWEEIYTAEKLAAMDCLSNNYLYIPARLKGLSETETVYYSDISSIPVSTYIVSRGHAGNNPYRDYYINLAATLKTSMSSSLFPPGCTSSTQNPCFVPEPAGPGYLPAPTPIIRSMIPSPDTGIVGGDAVKFLEGYAATPVAGSTFQVSSDTICVRTMEVGLVQQEDGKWKLDVRETGSCSPVIELEKQCESV